MSTNKILVTGAGGQLGRELQAMAGAFAGYELLFLTREELSIGDEAAVQALFDRHRPVWCINCAAYTAVDKAESEQEQALLINGKATGYLAAACHRVNARFLHVSTDYVFDGQSSVPLRESDPTGPINVYGATKLAGEQAALQENPATVILRTSWVYSEFGNNFVKTMIRLMKERESINVVSDQIGSPTYAADLAAVIFRIVTGSDFVPGIYNYSNEGQISWYEFAVAIRGYLNSSCQVNPIPSSAYPTPARRPPYSLLDKGLIRATYGVSIPDWKDSLAVCMKKLLA